MIYSVFDIRIDAMRTRIYIYIYIVNIKSRIFCGGVSKFASSGMENRRLYRETEFIGCHFNIL